MTFPTIEPCPVITAKQARNPRKKCDFSPRFFPVPELALDHDFRDFHLTLAERRQKGIDDLRVEIGS
jgi:hypothetical protein